MALRMCIIFQYQLPTYLKLGLGPTLRSMSTKLESQSLRQSMLNPFIPSDNDYQVQFTMNLHPDVVRQPLWTWCSAATLRYVRRLRALRVKMSVHWTFYPQGTKSALACPSMRHTAPVEHCAAELLSLLGIVTLY